MNYAREQVRRLGVVLCTASAFVGCREPTQVRLSLSTDVSCVDLDEVQIAMGELGQFEAPAATTEACSEQGRAPHRIGDLVVIPKKDKGQSFAVQVVAGVGQSAETCLRNGFSGGCIVARRAVAFQRHLSLDLPIELEVSCIDVPCGATETCSKGQCVDAYLPDPESCTLPGGCDNRVAIDPGGTGGTGGTGGPASAVVGGTGGQNEPTTGGTGGGSSSETGGTGGEPPASGGAGMGMGGMGTGGEPAVIDPVCGNGQLEALEVCDDGNDEDNDGCSANCREELLLAVDGSNARLMLLDRVTGDPVREFGTTPPGGPYAPLFAVQFPNGDVIVTDNSNAAAHRFDVDGNFLETVISGPNVKQIGFQLGAPLVAEGFGVKPYDLSTWTSGSEVALMDDLYGLDVLNDRWFMTVGLNYGEIYVHDRTENESPQSAHLLRGGAFDLHVTNDGRVLAADFAEGEVVELVSGSVPLPGRVIGVPLVRGRTVTVPNPFSVFELPSGQWLVGVNGGLITYNRDTGLPIATKSTDSYRTIEEYVGPAAAPLAF